jgi:hypothetical protein
LCIIHSPNLVGGADRALGVAVQANG